MSKESDKERAEIEWFKKRIVEVLIKSDKGMTKDEIFDEIRKSEGLPSGKGDGVC